MINFGQIPFSLKLEIFKFKSALYNLRIWQMVLDCITFIRQWLINTYNKARHQGRDSVYDFWVPKIALFPVCFLCDSNAFPHVVSGCIWKPTWFLGTDLQTGANYSNVTLIPFYSELIVPCWDLNPGALVSSPQANVLPIELYRLG